MSSRASSPARVSWLSAALKGMLLSAFGSVPFALCLFTPLLLGRLAGGAHASDQLAELAEISHTLVPVSLGALLVGACLGLLAARCQRRRLLRLLSAAAAGYALCIAIGMCAGADMYAPHATASLSLPEIWRSLLLSVWGVAAYTVFVGPPVLVGVLLLERWTARRAPS